MKIIKKIWSLIVDFFLYESPFADYELCSWSKPPEDDKGNLI